MRIGARRGSITIFMCIVLSIVIVLTSVLVDATRVKMASNIVDRAAISSMDSVLAGYEKTLKDLFGIFAIANDDEQMLLEELEKYFSRTLMTELGIDEEKVGERVYSTLMESIMSGRYEDARFTDLYDFQIEALSLEKTNSLIDSKIVKEQILEHMRYRAPKAWLGGFLDRLKGLKGVRRQTNAIKKSVGLDKKIHNTKEKIISLSKDVEKVNNAISNLDDVLVNIEEFIKQSSLAINYEIFLDYLNGLLSEKKSEKRQSDYIDEQTGELVENEALKKDIKKLEKDLLDLREKISNANSKARNGRIIVLDRIKELQKKKNGVLEKKKQVREKSKQVVDKANALLDELSADKSDFANDMKRQIKIKIEPFRDEPLDNLKIISNSNIRVLEDLKLNINRRLSVSKEDVRGSFEPSNAKKTSELLISPSNIIEQIKTVTRSTTFYKEHFLDTLESLNFKRKTLNHETTTGKDPREDIANSVKVHEVLKTEKIELKDEKKMLFLRVPSKNEKQNEIKTQSFENDFDRNNNNDINMLNDSAGMFEIFEREILDFKDELYINEYAIQTFKNITSKLENNWENDFRGVPKGERATFFELGEVEYLIGGSSSESVNLALVKSQVFLMRFALNSIYVYTDPVIKSQALTLATAAAGWWTGGLGIPIMHNIILLTLAFSESLLDVNQLINGNTVPVFKTKNTWNIGLTGLKRQATAQAHDVVSGVLNTGIDFLSDNVGTIKVKSYRAIEDAFEKKVDDVVNAVFLPIEEVIMRMENKLQGYDAMEIDTDLLIGGEFEKTGDFTIDLVQKKTLKVARSSLENNIAQLKNDVDSLNSENFYQKAFDIRSRLEEMKSSVKMDLESILTDSVDSFKKELDTQIYNLEQKGRKYLENGINSFFGRFDKVETSRASMKKSTAITSFSYSDYLRILLLMISNERKILRIQDLIQLNMEMEGYKGFDISLMHAGVDVNARVSIKYLFMTANFVPRNFKTQDGRRHLLKTNLVRSYVR